jgi:hypothetical protein
LRASRPDLGGSTVNVEKYAADAVDLMGAIEAYDGVFVATDGLYLRESTCPHDLTDQVERYHDAILVVVLAEQVVTMADENPGAPGRKTS